MEYRLRKVTPSKSVIEVKASSDKGGWWALSFGSHTAMEKKIELLKKAGHEPSNEDQLRTLQSTAKDVAYTEVLLTIEKNRIVGAFNRSENAHNAALDDIKADVEALQKAL